MENTSAGRGISSTDLVGSVTSLDMVISRDCLARVAGRPINRVTQPGLTNLEPHGAVPQPLILLLGAWFIPGVWGERFFGMPGVSRLRPALERTLKKALCHIHRFGGAYDKYRWFNMLINICTDHTSLGIWPSSISCEVSCSLFVTYCNESFLYVSVITRYWCWINILSTHFSVYHALWPYNKYDSRIYRA